MPTHWTAEEYHRLEMLYAEGADVAKIAELMGRGVDSIRWGIRNRVKKLASHRRKTNRPARPCWTAEEDQKLLDLRAEGKALDECAAVLGRSRNAVVTRLHMALQMRPREMQIPEEVKIMRQRLNEARWNQSEVARLLGEPPPGFSQLDVKMQQTQRLKV